MNVPAPATWYTQCELSVWSVACPAAFPTVAYTYDDSGPLDGNRCTRVVPPAPVFRAVTEPETTT